MFKILANMTVAVKPVAVANDVVYQNNSEYRDSMIGRRARISKTAL
jgi:hypothetical protein